MPYHNIPYYTISYYTTVLYTLPCHTIPYNNIPYYTILYYTISYNERPFHAIPYHTILYYAINSILCSLYKGKSLFSVCKTKFQKQTNPKLHKGLLTLAYMYTCTQHLFIYIYNNTIYVCVTYVTAVELADSSSVMGVVLKRRRCHLPSHICIASPCCICSA